MAPEVIKQSAYDFKVMIVLQLTMLYITGFIPAREDIKMFLDDHELDGVVTLRVEVEIVKESSRIAVCVMVPAYSCNSF